MAVNIYFSGPSGGTFSATLQRQADGYYFNPVAPAWQSAPTYANKKNALTEGSAENRGAYTTTLTTGLGNDGLVTVRIHNELINSGTVGISEIFISGGVAIPYPVTLDQANNAYYADVHLDRGATTDFYSFAWFKNAAPVLSGITQPSVRVVKRSDGTDLIASGTITQIGSIGAYKYDASGAERISTENAYVVEVTSIIDGAARTWRKTVGRDV